MKIELYYETITKWIQSSHTEENLKVCAEAIEEFITKRFALNEAMPGIRKALYISIDMKHKEITRIAA